MTYDGTDDTDAGYDPMRARRIILDAYRRDADAVINAIREKHNCHEAEVDDSGDVWINNPQRGHWLDTDELIVTAAFVSSQ